MSQFWQIQYYQTLQGRIPVYDFIEQRDVRIQAKIANTLDLLEQYGTALGEPHVKKLSQFGLWELRILGTQNTRIFYIAVTRQTFLLIHAFIKKKQKTDKREIKIALTRLKEYRSRKES